MEGEKQEPAAKRGGPSWQAGLPVQSVTDKTESLSHHAVVEGQITNHMGGGQPGVTVTVRRKTDDGSEGELVGTATTDDLGDFVVSTPAPFHGEIVVRFSKPHYRELTRDLHVGDDEFPPFIGEVLPGKLVVIGRVVDALTDRPVGDASVTLRSDYQDWHTRTNDRGEFTIKGVFPGKGELVVEARRYGREQQSVARLEDLGEIIVAVKPERILHIKLEDDAGKAIDGATVELYDELRDDFRTTVTDASGTATIRGLHFDAILLSARLTHEDYVSTEDFGVEIVAPVDRHESTHKLVMAAAGRISGRIFDADSGDLLNGARIVTGKEFSDTSPRDWSDHKGRYTITGVRPQSVVVTVHLSSYAPELLTVEVGAGKTVSLDVELRRGALISGVVKDEDGKPLAGAYVEATVWRGHATLGLKALTGQDGRFVIQDAPHDEFEIAVSGVGPAYRSVMPVTTTVKAGADAAVEIVLPPAAVGAAGWATVRFNVGDTAPTVKLTTLNGERLDFAALKGKIILLDFWATWCAPCVAEVPQLRALHEKFRIRKDFVMISISLDEDEQDLRSFVKKQQMNWHQVIGEVGGAQKAADRYGVSTLPAVFLVDADGKLVALDLHGAELAGKVEQVLKDNDPT